MTRLVIDCDPGLDDAVALVLASRVSEVVGITTVAGNVSLENTTRNALAISELLQLDVPVHRGSKQPRSGSGVFATEIHGESGLGSVQLPEPKKAAESASAVQYLLDIADPSVWIIATGPLTNLSYVIEQNPAWLTQIGGLAIMGGSTTVGNVTPVAEFNTYFDPEAADIVFNATGPKKMVGLNLTHQVQVSTTEVDQVADSYPSSPVANFMRECLTGLVDRVRVFTGTDEAALHDPCAVLVATHPQLFQFERRAVNIELSGNLTRGMTVVDQRKLPSIPESQVDVGFKVQSNDAKALIFQSIFTDPVTDAR